MSEDAGKGGRGDGGKRYPRVPASPRPRVLIAVIAALFVAVRVPLLLVREPFFDELVTKWFAEMPLGRLWPALAQDSGMPLYYAFCRLIEVTIGFDVAAGRVLSLLFGVAAIAAAFAAPVEMNQRMIAAAVIALFPPHVFFSTEARAYALTAALAGAGVVFLYRWSLTGKDPHLAIGSLAVLASAYAHPYGVLFFPLPAIVGLDRRGGSIAKGVIASVVIGGLFIPGFLLAAAQPSEAIGWMRGGGVTGLGGTPFLQLGFAAPYPPVLFTPPPVALQVASVVCVLALVIAGVIRHDQTRFFAIATLIPVLGVFAFGAAGALVYFPVRFESILAVPFALLLASGATATRWTTVVMAAALLIGAAVSFHAILDHRVREKTSFRVIADSVRARFGSGQPVVASGYAYLEVASQIGFDRVIAFPAEQARHPGWQQDLDEADVGPEVSRLPDRFIWVGSIQTAEAAAITNHYSVGTLERNGFIVAALAEKRSPLSVPRSPENGERKTDNE